MNFWRNVKIAGSYIKEAGKTLFGKSTAAKVAPTEFAGYERDQTASDPPPRNSSSGGNTYQSVPPNIDADTLRFLNLPNFRRTAGVRFGQIKEDGFVLGDESLSIATPQGMHEIQLIGANVTESGEVTGPLGIHLRCFACPPPGLHATGVRCPDCLHLFCFTHVKQITLHGEKVLLCANCEKAAKWKHDAWEEQDASRKKEVTSEAIPTPVVIVTKDGNDRPPSRPEDEHPDGVTGERRGRGEDKRGSQNRSSASGRNGTQAESKNRNQQGKSRDESS